MNLNDLSEEEKERINTLLQSIDGLHTAYSNECYNLINYTGHKTGDLLIHLLECRVSDIIKRMPKDRR